MARRSNHNASIMSDFAKGRFGMNRQRQASLATFHPDESCSRHGSKHPCPYCPNPST